MEETAEESYIASYSSARKAISRSRSARVFTFHLIAYILGNGFLGFWNFLTYFVRDEKTLWFFLPLLFWGVGLLIHFLNSVALFEEWWDLDERNVKNRLGG